MTTVNQNAWAQYLEEATQNEIRQMAEYAIDHLEKDELMKLRIYLAQTVAFA